MTQNKKILQRNKQENTNGEQFMDFDAADIVTCGHMLDIVNMVADDKEISLKEFFAGVSVKGFRLAKEEADTIFYYFVEDRLPNAELPYLSNWRLFLFKDTELIAYVGAYQTELLYQMAVPEDFLNYLSQHYFETGGRAFDYMSRKIIPWYAKEGNLFVDKYGFEVVFEKLPDSCKDVNLDEKVTYVNEVDIYSNDIDFPVVLKLIESQMTLENGEISTIAWSVPSCSDISGNIDWEEAANCFEQWGYSCSGEFESVFDKPNHGMGKNNGIVYKLSKNVIPITELCVDDTVKKKIRPHLVSNISPKIQPVKEPLNLDGKYNIFWNDYLEAINLINEGRLINDESYGTLENSVLKFEMMVEMGTPIVLFDSILESIHEAITELK